MFLFDRLANLVTGSGTAKDKATGAQFVLRLLSRQELEAAYRSDWLARKIIDIIPFDMTRAWREWQADRKQIEALEAEETRLQVKAKFGLAQQRARLYGGSAILIGADDERPQDELRPEAIKQGGLRYLHVLTQHDITAGALIRDPLSPYYGEPESYTLGQTGGVPVTVHPSRIIRFVGAALPDPFGISGSALSTGWGDPILQIVHDAVQNAASSQQTVASLLPDAKTDVITVPGLTQHLATPEGTARYSRRFAEAALLRSIHNVTLIDGGDGSAAEKWEQRQINFANFAELLRMYLQVAAGAADIPATRLLGQAPAGLNATGDSDVRNYYDHISAKQESDFRPRLDRLDEILIRSALGDRPKEIHYRFAPLWQLSDTEKADIADKKAKALKTLQDTGLVDDEVLRVGVHNQLVEDGTYPGLDGALKDQKAGNLGAGEIPDDDDPFAESLGNNVIPLRRRQMATDAAPRTLYVMRPVVNAAEILAWVRAQGFGETLAADDLHVTIAFSRTPIDWFKVWQSGPRVEIPPGGPRLMERFGGATVLLFRSDELAWRHKEFCDLGASWDHPEYQPHITISYAAADADLSKVEPYQGKIVLGPERFAEIDEDWRVKLEAAE
jgi:phage-related protein (TIGR01555 family)